MKDNIRKVMQILVLFQIRLLFSKVENVYFLQFAYDLSLSIGGLSGDSNASFLGGVRPVWPFSDLAGSDSVL